MDSAQLLVLMVLEHTVTLVTVIANLAFLIIAHRRTTTVEAKVESVMRNQH